MQLDIWSILIIVFVFHGLFLLSSILFTDQRRARKENRYLALMIIVLIWYLVEFLFIRNRIGIGLDIFYGTRYGSWFLFGPLAYFYFKSITQSNWRWGKIELVHFLPFIAFGILIPLMLGNVLNHRQVDYGMLSVFDHREKIITPLQYVYSFVFIAQFVHLGFYLFKNLGLINAYTLALSNQYSNINGNVKWLKIFNVSFLIILVFAALFLYILLVTDIYRRYLDYIYVFPVGALFYIISYYFLNTEWKITSNGQGAKYAKSTLNPDSISSHVNRLKQLMSTQKVYIDKELRLTDLAEKMELNAHHVSQLINQHFNLSFFDFVNEYRVQEAKAIIEENPDFTLLQVAFDAGFNNKTSFVNAFKKFEKTTPSTYRESLTMAGFEKTRQSL